VSQSATHPPLHSQLETEQSLLIPKSQAALSRYGHQLVIGNDLHKRKYEVVFVERVNGNRSRGDEHISGAETPPISRNKQLDGEEYKETWLRLSDITPNTHQRDGEVEIEELIIRELLQRHTEWIDAGKTS
jgi:phosphopantothenate-cysteine ligase